MLKQKILNINYVIDLVKQGSIMIMVNYYMKEIIYMEKEMGTDKNIMIMEKYYMKVNG